MSNTHQDSLPIGPGAHGQVRAAHRSVLAIAQPELGVIEVTGDDRVTWLNGLVTCDVLQSGVRRPSYGLILQRNGRILSDVVVAVDEVGARLLLAVPTALLDSLVAHLDRYLVMERAEIRAYREGFSAWALHGPDAPGVGDGVRGAHAFGGSLDRTGLKGAFFIVAEPEVMGFRLELERRVLECGGLIGDQAGWEALRIERGVARFGVDFGEATYPQEASLETSAVSFDKGCYLGQEVVCTLERRGHVKRKLVRIVVDAAPPPPRGAAVFDAEGKASGEVTCAVLATDPGRSVALAMVKRAHAEPGTRLLVVGCPAEVAARSV
ncbi:MAG: glycine cleavage T C-terminal barrel domain-containing protein [Polyangiaceae bacterium]|jgi:folate-binding protein YgfZ